MLNFGQTIWDKSEVLLGTSWGILGHLGTLWDPDENFLGTREKNKNIPSFMGQPFRSTSVVDQLYIIMLEPCLLVCMLWGALMASSSWKLVALNVS
jgi:hypothetical protein